MLVFVSCSWCPSSLAELGVKDSGVSQERWNNAAAFAQSASKLNLQLLMSYSIVFFHAAELLWDALLLRKSEQ